MMAEGLSSLQISAPIHHSIINRADSAALLFDLIISSINPVINTLLSNPDRWKSLAVRDAQLTVREQKNESMRERER